ncbi:GtrA family protein [Pontivivens insulae]|uniref:GtrA/DPMS transmembrane domain-containing protein n=1 Tax=Pontivivens insulae TaxID=1639689 RepID=A0A2R8AF92_9RHOB|nr:GtrA family protein [Pontivivens insulae]RED12157.1 putative flippase GtrA [Pontivivens insulae]SPF30913.1 hypothetical protein POI8812_03258 [Pontivivens insulae]
MSDGTSETTRSFQTEAARFARFLIVGGGVALIYAGLFFALRYWLVPTWLANVIAFCCGVLFQYVMQTVWTFRASVRDSRQQARFLGVIVFGLVFSWLATTKMAPVIGYGDRIGAALVIFVLPVFNFALYRFWVFRDQQSNRL